MSNYKTDSMKAAEKLAKEQYNKALSQPDNDMLRLLGPEGVSDFAYKLDAEQVEKLQSYIVISSILEKITWASINRLNEEATSFFGEGVPPSMLQDMVLLGLINQHQDKYGQISYQPTANSEEDQKAIYQGLLKRFKDEGELDNREKKLVVPFDSPFKEKLVKQLGQVHAWLTPTEILKIMGHEVSLTDKHQQNFLALLNDMVEEGQLEKHKHDLFRLKIKR